MRRRGFALLLALAALAVMGAAVLLIARVGMDRILDQRARDRRESALRAGEAALQRARSALAAGKTPANGDFDAGGQAVACKIQENTALLETLAACDPAPPPKSKALRRMLRITWTLARPNASAPWALAEWNAKDEVLKP
ncbi:MAG: hypothetical protein KIS92_12150 [Planctomycetota bacterium]|nr:hypothetical protein [Planctomycetota bacterium]